MDTDTSEDCLESLCCAIRALSRVTTNMLGIEIVLRETEWRETAAEALSELDESARDEVWFVVARNLSKTAKRLNRNIGQSDMKITRQIDIGARIELEALEERRAFLLKVLQDNGVRIRSGGNANGRLDKRRQDQQGSQNGVHGISS